MEYRNLQARLFALFQNEEKSLDPISSKKGVAQEPAHRPAPTLGCSTLVSISTSATDTAKTLHELHVEWQHKTFFYVFVVRASSGKILSPHPIHFFSRIDYIIFATPHRVV